MIKNFKYSLIVILTLIMVFSVLIVSLAASKPVNTAITNTRDRVGSNNEKWPGLGMGFSSEGKNGGTIEQVDSYIDILLTNGFDEIRMDIPNYANEWSYTNSKVAVKRAVAKGVKVVWGLSASNLTATSWIDYRAAILEAAQWAQDNGVYEFQLGNEEEWYVDGTTLTVAQLITNLKTVATEVQTIFTSGNISYTCARSYISNWVNAGKGDIDLLASNIYITGDGHPHPEGDIDWRGEIVDLVTAFGVDGTYLSEFNLSYTSYDYYSKDEAVQTAGVAEMIDYIKDSGMNRAFFYSFNEDSYDMSVLKSDGTYRQLWDVLN